MMDATDLEKGAAQVKADLPASMGSPQAAQMLLNLLSLSSTALPVGAYCYSQGVETAIDQGLIHDEQSALAYFEDVAALMLGRFELPLLARLIEADRYQNQPAFNTLAELYCASRETRELLAETRQMAFSLAAWQRDVLQMAPVSAIGHGFLPMYAALVSRLGVEVPAALTAYAFALLENQVLAAVKTVPLGQMAGQRILWALQKSLVTVVEQALERASSRRQPLASSLPGLALASMQHELQYSRLFRS